MRLRRGRRPKGRYLEHQVPVRVRFNEVDSLRIVWHGHFLKYFEDGRWALGQRYGIGYMDLLQAGFLVPVVHASCDHFEPARFGDELIVTTRLYEQESAKIFFYYEVSQGIQWLYPGSRKDDPGLSRSGPEPNYYLARVYEIILRTLERPHAGVRWLNLAQS